MIGLVLLAGLIILIVAGAAAREDRHPVDSIRWPKADDPHDAVQLEQLIAYGTPEDAERLKQQGVDLAALGYRQPDES